MFLKECVSFFFFFPLEYSALANTLDEEFLKGKMETEQGKILRVVVSRLSFMGLLVLHEALSSYDFSIQVT